MSGAPHIPEALLRQQGTASDPATSVWVSANAGSGKTYVLAQRVIRLLLDGVDPGKVLCLTFTKAAAANMAIRVFEWLSRWTALDDAALDAALLTLEGRRPPAARRLRARRLFAEALETPGGLKVQTIHAFCTGLLHQFPFEADVGARFEVLEQRAEDELIDRLRLDVLLRAAAEPESPLGRALATIIVAAADTTFAAVVRDAVGRRDAFGTWLTRAGSVDAAIAELSGVLGVAPHETQASIEAEIFADTLLPAAEWPAVMAALAQGGKSDQEHVARFEWAQAGADWTHIESYLRVFCTEKFEARSRIVSKAIEKDHPALHGRLQEEQARICGLLERRRGVILRERTGALIAVVDAVLRKYEAEKNRRGLLDYDDLIDKTLGLLSNEAAAWVHYKLDLGIDHILVDEAQDTSPKQWEVVRLLASEFTAGYGARGATSRSVFAVGDEKQSIYSFQGAAPHQFDEMRQHFQRQHANAGMAFERVRFLHSFRSAPVVLAAVDEVFGREPAFRGLGSDRAKTVHEAVRLSAPGRVELWPPLEPAPRREIEAWDAPFDTTSEDSPQVRLARRIAATVRILIARREPMPSTGAPITPGDVLVLVRQRGPLFEAIIRALKAAEVDVAGADRLVLTEHIAVMDLMSVADALLLPEDDLALAEVLRSPLFGLSDEQLFTLAWDRQVPLREALRLHASGDATFAATDAALAALTLAAREKSPFAFYSELLGARSGRKKFLARLGPEANDALDEFLGLALDYERRNTPSLQGFVAWLRAAQADVKRDMDIVRDEVRVMTVHGAKGLEAPLVILADTMTPPAGSHPPRLLTIPAAGVETEASPIVWAAAKVTDVAPVARAREAALRANADEHSRLLYVALTRAEDRLIVCGARGANKPPDGCWYDLVSAALLPDGESAPATDGDGQVWCWRKGHAAETIPLQNGSAAPPSDQAAAPSELPPWLLGDAPVDAAAGAGITPSTAVAAPRRRMPASAERLAERQAALVRGALLHRLLQALPDVPPARQAEAAHRFLARADPDLGFDDAERLANQVLRLIDDPRCAALFAPGSRAEVPLVGRLAKADGKMVPVSGQIDRLAVTEYEVLIADFKTDAAPPRRAEDVSPTYVGQLALYRALLSRLYPDRPVRALLVFTEIPEILEIPGAMLDAAITRLGTPAA